MIVLLVSLYYLSLGSMHGMISASEDGKDAIATHVQGMIEDHAPIPTPQTTAKYVDISFSDSAA